MRSVLGSTAGGFAGSSARASEPGPSRAARSENQRAMRRGLRRALRAPRLRAVRAVTRLRMPTDLRETFGNVQVSRWRAGRISGAGWLTESDTLRMIIRLNKGRQARNSRIGH